MGFLNCSTGISYNTPLTCSTGTTVPLLLGSGCQGTSTSTITELTGSLLTVTCPATAGQMVNYTLVASSRDPVALSHNITCATQYQTVFVRNIDCQPALSLVCSKGTTSGDPLLCNEGMLSLTNDTVGANCTLVGGQYVTPITVACPAASATPSNVTIRAVSVPNYGGQGCGETSVTLYYKSTGGWGGGRCPGPMASGCLAMCVSSCPTALRGPWAAAAAVPVSSTSLDLPVSLVPLLTVCLLLTGSVHACPGLDLLQL